VSDTTDTRTDAELVAEARGLAGWLLGLDQKDISDAVVALAARLEASVAKLDEIRKLVAWADKYGGKADAMRHGFDVNHYNLADEVRMILDEKEASDG
jgi:hypothetical protein